MHSEKSTILPSANKPRGFFGTMRPYADPHEAWALHLGYPEKVSIFEAHTRLHPRPVSPG